MLLNKLVRYYRKKRLNAFVSKVFKQLNSTVCHGPFKGMKYINRSHGSGLVPKLLGTYEMELHEVIDQIITTGYQNIVDIGCAEGYYAVGFAWKCRHPGFRVYAYDINEDALQSLKMLSALNSVSDRIVPGASCGHNDFERFKDTKTLIFCDIEGDEHSLLDPAKAPSLINYDLLVEIHDSGDEAGLIKTQLKHRFKQTHLIQLIKYTSRSISDAAAITCTASVRFRQFAVNEGRKKGLEWMWIKRL
jgi:precorrin-6B methylase 2